nr:integrase, catalytic region, zinc finger, CCHC-type, peptidase aspartic, catalytic [Tanacetum cinerariifolium]
MANLSENIQCAGSNTRPPMLDRTNFSSWQQQIRLYCRGKENEVSIYEGPFLMGTVREPLAEGTYGAPHLGPERPRIYSDLSLEEKDRYNANIRATNILLQGLPKDIYTLINHYTNAKDIVPWDNVKMLLEGSELTKEDRESQLNQGTVQDGRVVVQNVQGRQNRGQGMNPRGGGAAGYGGVQNRVRMPIRIKQDRLSYTTATAQENGVALDAEQLLFLTDLVTDEAGPSYDSDILSEYVKDNVVPVIHSNVSSVPTDAYMMIYNDMYEPHAQSISNTSRNTVVENSLTAELATYKEEIELYERRAKFELIERE